MKINHVLVHSHGPNSMMMGFEKNKHVPINFFYVMRTIFYASIVGANFLFKYLLFIIFKYTFTICKVYCLMVRF